MTLVANGGNNDVFDFKVDVMLGVGEVEVRGVVDLLMTPAPAPSSSVLSIW